MNPATDFTRIIERWKKRDELLENGLALLEQMMLNRMNRVKSMEQGA